MEAVIQWFDGLPVSPILLGLIGGVIITVFNLAGALLVLAFRRVSQAFLDVALGFAAGVMLSASFTSLILPGVEYGGILPVLAGIGLGALVLALGDRLVPHKHFVSGDEGIKAKRIRGVWLFIIAITLHNMPEGLAVGVGFGSGNIKEAVLLMMAIGIQNIPEGLAVSLSAVSAGLGSRWYAGMTGIRAGLVEIPLAVLGAWAVSSMHSLLPYAMGFAAGAMLFVISDEIIPETHRKGHERLATVGTLAGVCLMLFLDVSLG
jgi:zinc transporter, ZIP family